MFIHLHLTDTVVLSTQSSCLVTLLLSWSSCSCILFVSKYGSVCSSLLIEDMYFYYLCHSWFGHGTLPKFMLQRTKMVIAHCEETITENGQARHCLLCCACLMTGSNRCLSTWAQFSPKLYLCH